VHYRRALIGLPDLPRFLPGGIPDVGPDRPQSQLDGAKMVHKSNMDCAT